MLGWLLCDNRRPARHWRSILHPARKDVDLPSRQFARRRHLQFVFPVNRLKDAAFIQLLSVDGWSQVAAFQEKIAIDKAQIRFDLGLVAVALPAVRLEYGLYVLLVKAYLLGGEFGLGGAG